MSQTRPQATGIVPKIVDAIDTFQRRQTLVGFPYAVLKKFGDDQASYQAAILTYYSFLSIFPLLLVATTVIQLVAQHNLALQTRLSHTLTARLPLLGAQLQQSIHASNKTGIALVVGLLLTTYGAKGVADAFQNTLNSIWQVPKVHRVGFPKSPLKSLSIIALGGLGLVLSAFLSSLATSQGKAWIYAVFAFIVGYVIIMCTLLVVIRLGLSIKIRLKDALFVAALAAFGLQIVQLLGGYLVQHQLTNTRSLYGSFAIVLGLLFWLYIQAEIVIYVIEASTVLSLKLWPRALNANRLTPEDHRAYQLYAKRERYNPKEHVKVELEADR